MRTNSKVRDTLDTPGAGQGVYKCLLHFFHSDLQLKYLSLSILCFLNLILLYKTDTISHCNFTHGDKIYYKNSNSTLL